VKTRVLLKKGRRSVIMGEEREEKMKAFLLLGLPLLGAVLVACRSSAGPTATPTAPATVAASPTPAAASAANADVLFVRAVLGQGVWTLHVTVEHPDSGWEDYADGWDVVTPDGTVLKPNPNSPFTRLLTHPHENEQPFTRSQSGIVIPDGVTQVRVRAHDLVDGFGGREVRVDLTVGSGPDFEVERP